MLRELIDGIKLMFKEFFNKETNKKQRANMWTFTRLVLAFGIPIMAIIGKITSVTLGYILATVLTVGGALTDFVDGKSARKYNSVSDFGKKLDILADKVFAFMIGISLSLINPLFIFNILGEALISSINIYYQTKYDYIKANSSFIGKIKQWPLSISFILGYLSVFLPQLTMMTSILIFTSFLLELAVFRDYIKVNNKIIKTFENGKIDDLISDEINKKQNVSLKTNNKDNLKMEYTKLRDVLIQIESLKNNHDNNNNYIKVKKK